MQASQLIPAAEAEGHWLETTCRDTANEGHYAALSTLQMRGKTR